MKKKLAVGGFIKLLSGLLLLGLLLFVPAGTIHYPGAWRMICVLFIPMFVLGVVLLIANPKLLEKRLNQKESEPEQKVVIFFSSLLFVACFLLCGFDFRYEWTSVPMWLSIVGCIVFLATYAGFAELLRENEYLSRTVKVQEGQKVVSTRMYGIVRHPMYAIIFWMFLSMPIIIGSFAGLIPMVLLPFILVKRIKNEERVLKSELEGYEEYTRKVRYRLIPFIW
jgi:protein-S-isoprenylcysteine O-methyltransferase Ste14